MASTSKSSRPGLDRKFKPQPSSAEGPYTDDLAEFVYRRLRAVGMPEGVTLEIFTRLYYNGGIPATEASATADKRKGQETGHNTKRREISKTTPTALFAQKPEGNWKEVLDVLSTQLVGRTEASRLRKVVLRVREEADKSRSRIKAPTAGLHPGTEKDNLSLEDPQKAASARRETAYRILAAVRREWEVEQAKMGALDEKKRVLMREVDEKRRVLMMLGVLERREGVRLGRIGAGFVGSADGSARGIGDLIKELKREAALAMGSFEDVLGNSRRATQNTVLPPSSSSSSSIATLHVQKAQQHPDLVYKHTTNALANLHAYHARLAGLESHTGEVHGVESRLDDILKKFGLDGTELEDAKTKIAAVARQRAERKRKFDMSSVKRGSAREDDLEDMQRTNRLKKMEVQEKLNRAVALGWVCEGYIDLVSTFRAETAVALTEMLDVETKRVKGYVDRLKTDIIKKKTQVPGGFASEVRKIMGSTRVNVCEEVEDALKDASRSKFLTHSTGETATEIPAVRMEVERNEKLLKRKAEKAEYGYGIADEIRRLLDESRKLKHV